MTDIDPELNIMPGRIMVSYEKKEIVCVHRWGAIFSSYDVECKQCLGLCKVFWIADREKGFINEPRVIVGRIE